MVHTHNGVIFSYKKGEIMSFAAKWMQLEIIKLNELRQEQVLLINSLKQGYLIEVITIMVVIRS